MKTAKIMVALMVLMMLPCVSAWVVDGQVTGQGAPIQGAQVSVLKVPGNIPEISGATNSTGHYSLTISDETSPLYTIKVDSIGAYAGDSNTTPLSGDATMNFDLVPSSTVKVSGYVKNSTDNLGGANVKVKVGTSLLKSLTTDSSGHYSTKLGDTIDYTMTASKPSYISLSKNITTAGSDLTVNFTIHMVCPDADGDGHTDSSCGGDDCDDSDANIYPGNAESCDGIDNDCDGLIDEGCPDAVINSLDYPAGAWKDTVKISWNVSDPYSNTSGIMIIIIQNVGLEELANGSVNLTLNNGQLNMSSLNVTEATFSADAYSGSQLLGSGKLIVAMNTSVGSNNFDSTSLPDGGYNLIAVATDQNGPGENLTDTITIEQPYIPDDEDEDDDSSGSGGGPPPVIYRDEEDEETDECTEDWDCSGWEPDEFPESEMQTRTCSDINDCGTADDKPDEERSCTYQPPQEDNQDDEGSAEEITGAAVGGGKKSIKPAIGIGLLILGLMGLAGILAYWKRNK